MKNSSKNPFIGKWRIVEMELWDQDFVNMEVPGHFTFKEDDLGSFQFGAVTGETDCRTSHEADQHRIDFTWQGEDDMSPACGRGWAVITKDELHGRIFFHLGDDSGFRAIKNSANKKP
jgi:hypothetical protein